MTADLRYTPGAMQIPFDAAWRHHDRYARAVKLLGRYGTGDWLDYGCGTGYGTRYLADFTTGIIAFDQDDGAVDGLVGSKKYASSATQGGLLAAHRTTPSS